MSPKLLLYKQNAPLDRLALARVQLDARCPSLVIPCHGIEGILYSLTGSVGIYANNHYAGTLGMRERMTEEVTEALRVRGGVQMTLTLASHCHAADLLWISCATDLKEGPMVYRHTGDARWHTVGEGTHRRRVAEIPTPNGCHISCGETHNVPGGISSWPPHATAEDIEWFSQGETTWEEVMWFACSTPGIANLDGVYTGGKVVKELREIRNGSAHVMPLGSHSIHAGPGGSMIYVWAYSGTALQKLYNQAADDLQVYRK